MKHINILILVLGVTMLVLVGCSDVNNITKPGEINQLNENENESVASIRFTDSKSITNVPIIAGNDLYVGTVSLMTNKHDLYVTYQTVDGWVLRETNLHITNETKRIPVTKLNVPDIERFTYRTMHYSMPNDKYNKGVMEYTYKIPLESMNYKLQEDVIIAANAVLINEKIPLEQALFTIGWGGLEKGPGSSDWRYIKYTVTIDNPGGGEKPDAAIDLVRYQDSFIQ